MISSSAQGMVAASGLSGQSAKVLDRLREAIRARHYSLRTEETWLGFVALSSSTTNVTRLK